MKDQLDFPIFLISCLISIPCRQIEIQAKIYKTNEHPDLATTLDKIAKQRSNLGDYQKSN
jgi:hypothetical protein